MNLIAPPLKIWLIVFSIILLFSSGFYSYSLSQLGIKNKTSNHIEKLIQNNLSISKDTLSIVIVGSSLTRFAFGNNNDLSKTISRQLSRPVKVLKINIYALTVDKAVDLSIFQSLDKYPPDVLFIENRLFVEFVKNAKRIPFHISYTTTNLKNKLEYILGISKNGNTINNVLNPVLSNEYFTLETNQNILNSILERERRVRSMTENKVINITFDFLNKNKKKVILLGFPNSKQVNTVFDKTEIELEKLAQGYQNKYNVAYWSTKDTPFKDSFFTDGSHLNYEGARVYQKWFNKKIKTLL
jgi:hypothetical protein